MRRLFYLVFVAALVTVSCENTVDTLWVHENKAILVLNAQLFQDDTIHRIQVGCSREDDCETVDNATVTYCINDGETIVAEPVYVTDIDTNGEPKTSFNGYGFTTHLSPGDEIFLQASRATLTVSGTIKVPESGATITSMDTSIIYVPDRSLITPAGFLPTRQYAITVADKIGEKNYYLLRSGDIFYRLDTEGRKVDSYSCGSRIDTSFEQLLHSADNLDNIIGIADIVDSNKYDIFTDEMFTDTTYTLKVVDRLYTMSYPYRGVAWDNFWKGFETGDLYGLDRYFKVYTISFDEYIYLTALSSSGIVLLDDLKEPVVLPSNTTGGIGFITAATPSVWIIHFPTQQYSGIPPQNPYMY